MAGWCVLLATLARMETLDQQRARWAEIFDGVHDEVFALYMTRETWRVFRAAILSRSKENRGFIVDYLDRTYIATVCSAIRRQLDTDPHSHSLTSSLRRLITQPELVDRAYFLGRYRAAHEPDDYFNPDDAFNKYAASDSDTVNPAVIEAALEKLRKAARPVEKYADRVIAHRDRRSAQLTWGQLDSALAILEDVVKQFWGLAHPGVQLARTTPVIDLAFLHVFREPLIDRTFTVPIE